MAVVSRLPKPRMPKVNLVDALMNYAPTRGIALILGIGMVIWGVWVLLPFVAFTGTVYAFMLSLAAEPVWGGLFLFGGATMSYGVFSKNIDYISMGAFLGFFLWLIVAVFGVIAEPGATPVVTRGIIAAMHAWLYLQVKFNPELVAGTIKISDLRDYKTNRGEST